MWLSPTLTGVGPGDWGGGGLRRHRPARLPIATNPKVTGGEKVFPPVKYYQLRQPLTDKQGSAGHRTGGFPL